MRNSTQMRKLWLGVALAMSLLLPSAAWAASSTTGEDVTLAKGDNRNGTFYVAGNSVTINGDVNGDLVCAGQTVVVNGSIGGDVLCAAQSITLNGPVSGNVRVLGQLVTINGTVSRNVMTAAQNLVLGNNSRVQGELATAAQNVTLDGPVAQDVLAAAASFKLGSTIGGSLHYSSDQAFTVDDSKVQGDVKRHSAPQGGATQETAGDRLGSLVYWSAAGLLIMLAAIWLAPKLVRNITAMMMTRPGASIGWGALVMIGTPLALLILAITLIGLPLTGLIAALWLIGILTAGLFAGVALSLLALGPKETDRRRLTMAALAGVPLVVIVSSLPLIGFVVSIVATAWTMGAVALSINKLRKLG